MTIAFTYEKAADHIVVEKQHDDEFDYGMYLQRTFNFRSRQITTVSIHPHGRESASSMQMFVQNFSDIEGQDDIKAVREELVKLGGNPPDYKPDEKKSGKLKLD